MTVNGEEKEVPIQYGGGEDEEAKDKESTHGEGKEPEPETKPDDLSEPADEESELRVEESHDEL